MRRHDRELSFILLCLLLVGVFLLIFVGLSVDGQWKTTRVVQSNVLVNYGAMQYGQKHSEEGTSLLLEVSNLILPELLNLSKSN